MKFAYHVLIVIGVFLTAGQLQAHGVDYEIIQGGIGIKALYDDGQPLSFSECKIYSPGNTESAYQQGLTDKYGRFLFVPDTSGIWKIEVDDGMGHGLIQTISVTQDLTLAKGLEQKHLNRYQEVIIGISIIFGLTGIGYYLAGRNNIRRS